MDSYTISFSPDLGIVIRSRYGENNWRAFLLSLSLQLSRDVPTDEVFLCDTAVVLGAAIKQTPYKRPKHVGNCK